MSACRTVGIFDSMMLTTTEVGGLASSVKASVSHSRSSDLSGSNEYEIFMPIDSTIFYTTDLLPSNTAIDLSFERTTAKFSSIQMAKKAQDDSSIELKDVYLIVPFKKSDELFQLERNAVSRPIKLRYDDYVIKRFNIPKGTANVNMFNLLNGPLPNRLFWGIQTMESYGGSMNHSSTRFNQNDLRKVNLYIDGKEVGGFPVSMTESHVTQPYVKYLENTNQ